MKMNNYMSIAVLKVERYNVACTKNMVMVTHVYEEISERNERWNMKMKDVLC